MASLPSLLVATHLYANPVRFHQFALARLGAEYGSLSATETLDTFHSAITSGWNIISRRPATGQPDLHDPQAVFDYIFDWLPPYAVVYPTEGFYYWEARVKDAPLYGNLRVADLDAGFLTMAYFVDSESPFESLRIGSESGLSVSTSHERVRRVSYRGKTVAFKLPKTGLEELDRAPLGADEEAVGHIYDDSGVCFFLLYNHATNSFYNILSRTRKPRETFARLDGDHIIGERSGFIFFEDRNLQRELLVGVDLERVRANDHFDGPGDQVPYGLNLRDKLYLAYPNTMLDGGVDEHGVYRFKEAWTRVAISPYQRYADPEAVSRRSAQELASLSEIRGCVYGANKGVVEHRRVPGMGNHNGRRKKQRASDARAKR